MGASVNRTTLTVCQILAWVGLAVAGVAVADDYSGFAFTIGGFIRPEFAIATNDEKNPYNQGGETTNGVPVMRTGFYTNPPWPFSPPPGGPLSDTVNRTGIRPGSSLNMSVVRGELDTELKFNSSWSFTAKLKALHNIGSYDQYNPAAVGSTAVGPLYGRPDYYTFDVVGNSHPNPLEWAGRDYLVQLPAFFVEYNNGPLDLRLGNQQIAWGQALFFRVLDIPDGLDLRRHSALDYAPEEFSDKRVPALAGRLSYQLNGNWLLDAYAQKFQPTIQANPNTPYNAIFSEFTVHDRYDDYQNKLSFGARMKGQVGDVGLQFLAARRYNPDGAYRWTASGVNRDIPGLVGTGAVLAQTPFEVDPSGVWSANQWFRGAAAARLDGFAALNSAVSDFPAGALLGAFVAPNQALARLELDTFFQLSGGLLLGNAAGGLRGHIERRYFEENNFGAGTSYVFSGNPGSFTDQLIMNVEVLYAPDRIYTAPSLGKDFVRKSEIISAFVFEKNQRFSDKIPATYLVLQWMHRTQSDIFGRYLGGYGGTETTLPTGRSGYDAIAIAVQQPFAGLVWRADLSVLYDLKGGVLVQPAARWKPNKSFQGELFYNYLNGTLGSNPNDNALSTFNFAKEVGIRLAYQF
jgi:hypothetical protein